MPNLLSDLDRAQIEQKVPRWQATRFSATDWGWQPYTRNGTIWKTRQSSTGLIRVRPNKWALIYSQCF